MKQMISRMCVRCPNCRGTLIRVSEDMLGGAAVCTQCKADVEIAPHLVVFGERICGTCGTRFEHLSCVRVVRAHLFPVFMICNGIAIVLVAISSALSFEGGAGERADKTVFLAILSIGLLSFAVFVRRSISKTISRTHRCPSCKSDSKPFFSSDMTHRRTNDMGWGAHLLLLLLILLLTSGGLGMLFYGVHQVVSAYNVRAAYAHGDSDRLIEVLLARGDHSGSAAVALGHLGDPVAVDPLIAAMGSSNSSDRKLAAEALGRIGDARAVDSLLAALRDPKTRNAAITSLGQIGDARAAQPLARLLSEPPDKYSAPRWGAYQASISEALVGIGDPAAEHLVELLTNRQINRVAADILQRLAWQPSEMAHQVYMRAALHDTAWLRAEENLDAIRSTLMQDARYGNTERRHNALRALVNIGNPDALPDLVMVIREHGDLTIANAYLNSGNHELESAARRWAQENGYTIGRFQYRSETWTWNRGQ